MELDLVTDRGQCVKRVFERNQEGEIGYVVVPDVSSGKFQCDGWVYEERAMFLEQGEVSLFTVALACMVYQIS